MSVESDLLHAAMEARIHGHDARKFIGMAMEAWEAMLEQERRHAQQDFQKIWEVVK